MRTSIMSFLRGGPKEIEENREILIDKGIYKREAVFGNFLRDTPLWNDPLHPEEHELPQFVVRCVQKIENMDSTVGVYRINGDAAVVQSIR